MNLASLCAPQYSGQLELVLLSLDNPFTILDPLLTYHSQSQSDTSLCPTLGINVAALQSYVFLGACLVALYPTSDCTLDTRDCRPLP